MTRSSTSTRTVATSVALLLGLVAAVASGAGAPSAGATTPARAWAEADARGTHPSVGAGSATGTETSGRPETETPWYDALPDPGKRRTASRTPAADTSSSTATESVTDTAAATALPAWTIRGAGFGHAVGLSQYGAEAMGRAGRSAAEILGHYYRGSVYEARTDTQTIRVNVERGVASIAMSTVARTSGGGSFVVTVTGGSAPGTVTGGPASAVSFTRSGSEVRVSCSGCSTSSRQGARAVVDIAAGSTFLRLGSSRFDLGGVHVHPTSGAGTLEAVQWLRVHDDYLDRIREVPWSWSAAALQGQAAAARAYALRAVATRDPAIRSCRCHVTDTSLDQVYGGYPPQTEVPLWPRWKAAVRAHVPSAEAATKGMVPTYAGSVVEALYSASSGGYTQNNEDVWGGSPVPYLRSEPDSWSLDSSNPWASWRREVGGASLAAAFGLPDVARLAWSDRTVAGAVDVAVATSAAGSVRSLDGEVLARRLALPSAFERHRARRLYGTTPYSTAAVSARTVTSTATAAVVASGDPVNLSDAVAAGPLAASVGGPLLLTEATTLSSAAAAEIKRRRPTLTSVLVVGRTSAVSDSVVSQLRSLGVAVRRIAGADRYATSAKVAEDIDRRRQVTAVVVAHHARDAIPASGPASALREPILWTPAEGLPATTRTALATTGATSARVVGSTAAVTSTVVTQLHAGGIATTRLTGSDRYRAAAAVARFYAARLPAGREAVVVSGLDGALVEAGAASNRRSIMVYAGDAWPGASADVLQRRPALEWVTVVGGAVPSTVLRAARDS